MMNQYEFDAIIQKINGIDGSYVVFSHDIRVTFNKGRLKVHTIFDETDYDGSIVNMGLKHLDGSIAHIIGIRKEIRSQIQKAVKDVVHVSFQERMC